MTTRLFFKEGFTPWGGGVGFRVGGWVRGPKCPDNFFMRFGSGGNFFGAWVVKMTTPPGGGVVGGWAPRLGARRAPQDPPRGSVKKQPDDYFITNVLHTIIAII